MYDLTSLNFKLLWIRTSSVSFGPQVSERERRTTVQKGDMCTGDTCVAKGELF